MLTNVQSTLINKSTYNAFGRLNEPQHRIAIRSKEFGTTVYQYIFIEPMSHTIFCDREEISFEIRDNQFTLVGWHLSELFSQLQKQRIEYISEFCDLSFKEPDSGQPIINTIKRETVIRN